MKFIIVCFMICLFPMIVTADEAEDVIESQFENYSAQMQELDIEETAKKVADGEFSLNPLDVLNNFIDLLFGGLKENFGLIIQLVVLVFATALLTALKGGFGGKGVGEIAFFACYTIIAGVAVKVFINAASEAEAFLKTGAGFINGVIPLLFILLGASGGVVSSALISPVMIFATQAITFLIQTFFMPLCFAGVTLSIANNLSEKIKVSGMISLINNIIKWGLGVILTLFVGVITIYSMFAPNLDARAVAVGEYTVKTFIPIVGSILSDTVELVGTCASVVKSSVGVAGLIGFISLSALPIINLLAQIGALKLTGMMVEPVADKRIVKCINDVSGGLSLILVMLFVMALMFFINVAIIVKIGGNNGFF